MKTPDIAQANLGNAPQPLARCLGSFAGFRVGFAPAAVTRIPPPPYEILQNEAKKPFRINKTV